MFRKMYERITCEDGFSMSVQAGEHAYCSPRVNAASRYSEVEVGYPSGPEPLLEKYAEDPEATVCSESGTVDTVYGWVPASTIREVVEKHGGLKSGELPPLK